jgi:cytochrome P450
MQPVQSLGVDEIDLSDLAGFWTLPIPEREGAFLTLRTERPVAFFDEPQTPLGIAGPGYWAITRYEHVVEASRNPAVFSSARGATNIADLTPELLEYYGSMINMADPRHARLRRIVSRAFTPKRLAAAEATVETVAAEIIDRVGPLGGGDFVTEVAAALPLRIICDMMGVPAEQYDYVFEQTNIILGASDDEYLPEGTDILTAVMNAGIGLGALMTELAAERQARPTDDLTSALVTAEVDGERLSFEELASFFILLVVAGNETTRNAISWGLHALSENPDQLDAWRADPAGLAPSAVEEIVRWATPVIQMRRSLLRDHRLGDQELHEGDKVLLFYNSANRDAAVFDEPFRFDLRRTDNRHAGFGGYGPHFCLGAHLARREIAVMFRQLLTRLPDIHAEDPPEHLRSMFINGIKHLRAAWTPTA